MTIQELADRINRATPEQVAQAMERLKTDELEWAVRFEALGQDERRARE
jgi:hypothetical protein